MKPQPRLLLATCLAAALSLALTGCGSKHSITGIYVGVPGKSVFDKVELKSGGRAVFTLIGIDHEATYSIEGSTVAVKNPAGERHELKIDGNGCLVDAIGGTYCKEGNAAGGAANAGDRAAGAPRSGGLSGTYEAKGPEGASMTITFTDAANFTLVMRGSGMSNSLSGSYQLEGDHVLLRVTGETDVLDLVRRGNALEGELDGDRLKFVRK